MSMSPNLCWAQNRGLRADAQAFFNVLSWLRLVQTKNCFWSSTPGQRRLVLRIGNCTSEELEWHGKGMERYDMYWYVWLFVPRCKSHSMWVWSNESNESATTCKDWALNVPQSEHFSFYDMFLGMPKMSWSRLEDQDVSLHPGIMEKMFESIVVRNAPWLSFRQGDLCWLYSGVVKLMQPASTGWSNEVAKKKHLWLHSNPRSMPVGII